MLYARKAVKPITQRPSSIMIKPENESVKVDVKNWSVEASGLITWIVVFGVLILGGAYIYGKFFHEKVKGKLHARRTRKKKK